MGSSFASRCGWSSACDHHGRSTTLAVKRGSDFGEVFSLRGEGHHAVGVADVERTGRWCFGHSNVRGGGAGFSFTGGGGEAMASRVGAIDRSGGFGDRPVGHVWKVRLNRSCLHTASKALSGGRVGADLQPQPRDLLAVCGGVSGGARLQCSRQRLTARVDSARRDIARTYGSASRPHPSEISSARVMHVGVCWFLVTSVI